MSEVPETEYDDLLQQEIERLGGRLIVLPGGAGHLALLPRHEVERFSRRRLARIQRAMRSSSI